jgi:hypothetical protein
MESSREIKEVDFLFDRMALGAPPAQPMPMPERTRERMLEVGGLTAGSFDRMVFPNPPLQPLTLPARSA